MENHTPLAAMSDDPRRFKILFLCAGNSARSILAEYLLRRMAGDRFEVFSAGANPRPAPHPMTLQVLKDAFQIDASDARSKSLAEFSNTSFDFVITLCDESREKCPIWPGRPIVAHWEVADPVPAHLSGGEQEELFWQVAHEIQHRLELFASLPIEKLDALRLEAATREIGAKPPAFSSEG